MAYFFLNLANIELFFTYFEIFTKRRKNIVKIKQKGIKPFYLLYSFTILVNILHAFLANLLFVQ